MSLTLLKESRSPVIEISARPLAKEVAADVLTFDVLAERFIRDYASPEAILGRR